PISAIMIHGRSLKQGFTGAINYDQIKKVKSIVNIPVLANGGVNTPEDAKKMLDRTVADGIGIARGALTKPWLFSQTKEFLEKGEYQEFSFEEIKKATIKHAKMSYKSKGKHGIIEMRKYLIWYFRGFKNAKEARKKLVKVESVEDIRKNLNVFK
ncbi:MAG: tRNA-dihydrouridine synthase, partial [Candidatus Pacebacteria bacterium]|nr:tRNA-dihydrouridine synthase [Candidatus Paceibacterota bacterium]